MPPFSKINRPRLFTYVKTTIGTGLVVGKSENPEEALIAFHREDMTQEYLDGNPSIQGNPNLWINLADITEDLGMSLPEKKKIGKRKKHGPD